MSTSLGIPNDYTNPQYIAVVEDIIKRCEAVNVPVMVHQQNIADSTMAIERGARFVLHATDSNILQRALQSEFNALREIAGGVAAATRDTVDVV
jgi:2-keto-3-deoxy-L-rhamnonate aldolase RhmA